MITGDSLAAVWPEVSHRLAKLLTSRGAAPDVVDDVVQEVAARVLAKRIVFDDAMDLMRWAVPVALNLLVDHARAAQRVTPVCEDHDEPVGDVADLVGHRDRLRRVMCALPQLSAADRAALTYAEGVPADRKEAVRLAVRRHRARRRLLALVDGVAAFAALVGALLRRSSRAGVTATVALAVTPVAFLVGSAPAPEPAAVPDVVIEVSRPVRVSHGVPRPAARGRDLAPAPVQAPGRAATAVRQSARAPREEVVRVGGRTGGVSVEKRKRTAADPLLCLMPGKPLQHVCVNPFVGRDPL